MDFKSLELPIEKVTIRGPAVDRLAVRKEKGDPYDVTPTEMRGRYEASKVNIFHEIKMLTAENKHV